MIGPPAFASAREYRARLADVGFWRPYVAAILERHDLADAAGEPVAGVGGTHPAFVCGDVVVKLFGPAPSLPDAQAAERAAHALLATDPDIAAPVLLGEGRLFEGTDAPWSYLATSRMAGVPWADAVLSREQRLAVAADLGRQVRRVHALRPTGIATPAEVPAPDVVAAAQRSSLPPHLIGQIDAYLTRLEPFDMVFVHGDLFARHPFVANGRLAGIIDWGEARVADRHFELAKLHLDTFDADKALLRAFLEASDWPTSRDLPRRALGLALHRQAAGIAHDTFFKLPALLPLHDIGTLDELADELFAV